MNCTKNYELLKGFHPAQNKMFSILQPDGTLIDKTFNKLISDEKLVEQYKKILFARTADLQIVSYQRQGRIFTYPPVYGQEVLSASVFNALQEEDWIVPAYRELALVLMRGVTLKDIFLLYMGNEEGMSFKDAYHVLPYSVPISTQFLHAAGLAYGRKYQKKDEAVFAFIGDGGTSEGDFHEGLNFASVWKVPVVFIVENNQYAISTSIDYQTNAESFAIKAMGYGIPGLKVDGNDYFAMIHAVTTGRKYAMENSIPVLIEAVTYRKGPHTTSDDPSKYRSKAEEKEWDEKDAILRLKHYLVKNKLWNEKKDKEAIAKFQEEIDVMFTEAENHPKYELNDVFDHIYVDKPGDLSIQQREHEEFLQWKSENL